MATAAADERPRSERIEQAAPRLKRVSLPTAAQSTRASTHALSAFVVDLSDAIEDCPIANGNESPEHSVLLHDVGSPLSAGCGRTSGGTPLLHDFPDDPHEDLMCVG